MDPVVTHGWTAVPVDADIIKKEHAKIQSPPKALSIDSIPAPKSPIVNTVKAYAQQRLPQPTFNHSMRVFYYGRAMQLQHFPDWKFSDETYMLCCLLHDIGTTPENLRATMMSFEFYGGMLSYSLLTKEGVDKALAEAVMEAVVRHQDVGKIGKITAVGQLLQLATIFDNMGGHSELVHEETIKSVVAAHPRLGWSKCFHDTIREENGLKPWAHTTALGEEDFPNGVLNNKLMAPYDNTK
ncbi:MAG: hypothetical protein Q9159_002231 [Coniocarpon cinnabarinum]